MSKEQMDEMDIEKIIQLYDKGILSVNDVTTSSETAMQLSKYWMDFSDEKKYSQLKLAIEHDEHFDKLRSYFSEKYSGKRFIIKQDDLEVREIFKDLTDLEKFMGLAYIGLEHGIAYTDSRAVSIHGYDASFINNPKKYIEFFEKHGEKDVVEFIKQVEAIPDRREKGRQSWRDVVAVAEKFKDKFGSSYDLHTYGWGYSAHQDGSWDIKLYKKEWEDTLLAIDLIEKGHEKKELLYRIGDWHQGQSYSKIVNTFALGHLLRTWDEETAIDDAIGSDWDLNWRGMADVYLTQKGSSSITKHNEDVAKFKEICTQAEVLKSIEDSIKIDDKKLKQYFGTDDLFKSYSKLEPIAKELQGKEIYATDKYLFAMAGGSRVEGDYFYFPPEVEHFNDPDSVKGLVFSNLARGENAETQYFDEFVFVKDGKMTKHTFSPHYKSSKLRTSRDESQRVKSVDDVVETEEGLLVKYTDGYDVKKEYRVKL